MNQFSKVKFTYDTHNTRLRSFNELKRVHSYDLTNTIVKTKNKTNLFNNQLASNIKIQSF